MTNPEIKNLFKEALTEVLESRPDLIENAVLNAVEDISLIKAIEEGDKKDYVNYEKLMKVMDRKINALDKWVMTIHAEKTFLKDVDKVKDKTLLLNLQRIFSFLNETNSTSEIPNLKKLSATKNYYRIRIGDYRIGMSIVNKEVYLIRFLHRKDIYKYFP